MLQSSLRFLSRDLSTSGTALESSGDYQLGRDTNDNEDESSTYYGYSDYQTTTSRTGDRNLEDSWHYGGYDFDPQSGIGGWSDFDAVANAARATLQDAAGITPPSGCLLYTSPSPRD